MAYHTFNSYFKMFTFEKCKCCISTVIPFQQWLGAKTTCQLGVYTAVDKVL